MLARSTIGRLRAAGVALLGIAIAGVLPAHASPWAGDRKTFASPRFEQVWRSADQAVREGRTNRSWTWGPQPWFDYKEFYKQSPNGLRLVQYFDKARMEINTPANTSGPLGGVTNGLLVVEMVSGRIKLGDGAGDDQNAQLGYSAASPVAGDLPASANKNADAPTYASFRSLATTDNGYRDAVKTGQRAGATIDRTGVIGQRQDLASIQGTDFVVYEPVTGHNVPRVFDDFRNAGPAPAIFAFGFPISDPYWVRATVAGQPRDVLVQLFERRTLTYTPSNPPAFQVEMGNVGQHYFAWRYGVGEPWAAPDPALPITYAGKKDLGGTGEATTFFVPFTLNADGSGAKSFPYVEGDALPYSVLRSWDTPRSDQCHGFLVTALPQGSKRSILHISNCFKNGAAQLLADTGNSNNYDPAISPDGKKVAFVTDRDGNPELYLIPLGYDGKVTPTRLTDTIGCANQHPSWLPDGTGLVYESNCQGGNFEMYRGDLSYSQDNGRDLAVSKLISPVSELSTRLTNTAGDDRWPRVSPDGSQIAFFSTRDGNPEIYTMRIDGSGQTRLTNNPAVDEGPTWSPDGSKIAFNSNRDGDHEIFVMDRSGGGQTQLTNNSVDDRYAVWAQ